MKSRIGVAVVGIPIVYLAVWLQWRGALAFALLVTVAATIAVLEFYELLREHRPYVPAGMLAVGATPLLAWAAYEPGLFAGFVIVVPLTMAFALMSHARRDPAASVTATLAGVLYVGTTAGLAVILRASSHGFGLVLILLAGIWVTDSAAYFVGRAIGRHKLAPRVSPNKTIEGFVGGLLVGTGVVWYLHFLTGESAHDRWLGGWQALAIGIVISLAATVGDLFESMLKRAVGVKDSGRLLGDHGGMLDRIDALLVAVPVMYVASFLLGVLP